MSKKTIKKMSEIMKILMARHTPGRPADNGVFIVNLAGFRASH